MKAKSKAAVKATDWVFEKTLPMGGAAGEAYTNTLAASGMPPASVLAREAVQNSVDARANDQQKVAIDFTTKSITGTAKQQFLEAAKLSAIQARSSNLGFKQPNCLNTLDNLKKPLRLLFVNDYNTTGLAGDPASPSSKFSRFLLSLGDGGKEHEEHGTGGSYGFGKSVYSSNSGLLTIFAYSRTLDGNGKPMSLLFGCGYYRNHTVSGNYYTGRAWFGRDETPPEAHAQQIVRPLRDEEADAKALALGFDKRETGALGTSVLIVDSLVQPKDILHGVEDWWWPRLVSNLLDVRVSDLDGDMMIPRPRKRQDLRPFLEAFDVATGKSPSDNKSSFRRPFNKSDGLGIGAVGLRVLERNDKDEFSVPEKRVDSVALIRSPLMVVAYDRRWNVGTPAMAGAFIADDDIDDILRSAEPPAHDEWDSEARRLQDESGRNRQIVERVLQGIRRNIKQAQQSASPPPPPRPKRLALLERTLASFLAPSKTGTKKSGSASPTPINLTYDVEPRAEANGKQLRLTSVFNVRLKPEEDIEKLRIRVRVTCPIVEDGETGDDLAVSITASKATKPDPNKSGWQVVDLTRNQGVKFMCETEPYDPLWTVRFVPEIEAVEVQ